ncbi:MAG: UDP-N-acetylmuramoyl-L-alanyl-D-glutamate--2,6-diaminopimelate ligase [Candidatus Gottesmanbacteria bacterium]|nr:UDP-N-acetylmuramoyl-L-alanyl-D-glutamate--2,6-diaminopimelate ligase [Candidatus Gottesmanbacteria bacterium]
MLRSLKGLYHLLLAVAANIWYGFPSRHITVIGVTGTDGKTTTTTLIYEILAAAGYKASMITTVHAVIAGKTYDTGLHVTNPGPFAIQKYLRAAVNHGDSHMVLEVTSHGLAQHRVLGVRFAIGVITNVTHEHLDWHRTFEHYLATKLSLLTRANVAVINRDEAELYNRAIPLLRRRTLVTYGIRREAKITPQTYPFTTQLMGEFNQYNCLAALSVAHVLGISKKVAREAVAAFTGVPGRMEIVKSEPFTVIVDFAHTPNAIDQVLKTARTITKKRLIHVFGSAGLRDRTKRSLMGKASGRFADVIVLTEEDYRTENVETIMDEIAAGIEPGPQIYRFPDRQNAIDYAIKLAGPGDVVIITGKGHEQSLARGRHEYPWSDQAAVKKACLAGGRAIKLLP